MLTLWKKYRQLVFKNVLGQNNLKDLTYWRNRMFAESLTFLLPLFLLIVSTGIYWAIQNNVQIIIWLDLALIVTFIYITLFPNIKVSLRKKILLGSAYIMGVVLIYVVGLPGPGLIYLYTCCVFGIFFFQNKYAFLFAALNAFICLAVGVLIPFGIEPKDIQKMGGLTEWIILSSNIIFLSFLSAALIPGLFKGLQQTLLEQIMLSNKLKEKQESLEQSNLLLSNAYKTIVDIEEQERQRLAGEIHDGVSQSLVALKMIFAGIERKLPEVRAHQQTALFYEMLGNTLDECRQIVNKVRPKELIDKGLDSILKTLLEKMNSLGKTQLKLQLFTSLDEHFEYADRFHLYRIVQENINNTFKYADATEAIITAEKSGNNIVFTFTDNGKGIDINILCAAGSFLGIKRRITVLNGKFDVYNNVEKGVTFRYEIPISADKTIPANNIF